MVNADSSENTIAVNAKTTKSPRRGGMGEACFPLLYEKFNKPKPPAKQNATAT